jgi:hypothetical protein
LAYTSYLESTLAKVFENKPLYLVLESTLMQKPEGATLAINPQHRPVASSFECCSGVLRGSYADISSIPELTLLVRLQQNSHTTETAAALQNTLLLLG